MTMKTPIVSFVLGSYNRKAFLKKTLGSVRDNGLSFPYEIIVVDGGSSDGSLRYLERQKDVITIIQHNRATFRGRAVERRSWGYFMNLGFKAAQGKYICMISDDCLLLPSSVTSGVNLFEQLLAEGKKIGAMAFYWRNWPEQQKYWVGKTFGNIIFVNHGLYLRKAFAEIGFCDEQTFSFYHADGDICLRMHQAGYDCAASPKSFVEHYSHANVAVRMGNLEQQQQDWLTYTKRWEHMGLPDSDWIEKDFLDRKETVRKYWHRPYCYNSLKASIYKMSLSLKRRLKGFCIV